MCAHDEYVVVFHRTYICSVGMVWFCSVVLSAIYHMDMDGILLLISLMLVRFF